MSQPGSRPPLPAHFSHDRLLGLHLLWEQQPDDLAARLVAFLDDPLLDVRRYAADRLCDLGQPAVPELLGYLDRAADARRAAAVLASTPPGREALAARPGGALDLLEEAFGLPDLTARLSRGLIRAMVICEDPRVDRRLSSLRHSRWPSVRAAAAAALRARGWERHYVDRAERYRVGDFTVEVIERLSGIGDPRVVAILMRFIASEHPAAAPEVRATAEAALDRLLGAERYLPATGLSRAAAPGGALGAAALSLWRAEDGREQED